jgi:mono/diheme cytochrome c family protein
MKILKIGGLIILFLILIIATIALYINFSGIPKYPTEEVKISIEASPDNILRGKKLASMLCVNCHKSSETGKLTGTRMRDLPAEFGTAYSPNITNHPTSGIGSWSDGEIAYLLRTGIKKDGVYSPPYMPKFPNMANEDIEAIIAFLRSEDNLVAPDPTPSQESEPSFLTKFLCRVAFKPLSLRNEVIEIPDSSDVLELGKYYAHNLDCFACHSSDFKTIDPLNPENSRGYF